MTLPKHFPATGTNHRKLHIYAVSTKSFHFIQLLVYVRRYCKNVDICRERVGVFFFGLHTRFSAFIDMQSLKKENTIAIPFVYAISKQLSTYFPFFKVKQKSRETENL